MTQYISGNIRVQTINAHVVRLEYSPTAKFCDDDTFFVPNRVSIGAGVSAQVGDGFIEFGEYRVNIPKDRNGLDGITLERNGNTVYSYVPIVNSGELPDISCTPKVYAIADSPRIIMPTGGYAGICAGKTAKAEEALDVYLLLCEGDFKLLRELYVSVTGRPELVRLSTLGSWNSKYYVYNEQSAKQLILDYIKNDVPLDNMVVDTDWRKAQASGIGYEVNTELFPDLKRFFDFAHGLGVEIMFNDHPEPLNGARSMLCKEEAVYRTENLQAIMDMGLDTWWYDRNWHTKLISPVSGVAPETLGMYVFGEITRNFYEGNANGGFGRRPVIMSNVNNIFNGIYYGITDSASHRYSVQWTGDIESDLGSIEQEIHNMLRAGDNCIPYVHADCGGHMSSIDAEQFVRWMQFGCFSPVFRPHCCKSVTPYREPWLYDKATLDTVRDFIKLRYRLLPVLYSQARASYDCGSPVFRSLEFAYPADNKAKNYKSEYMLGDGILIAPIYGNRHLPLEKTHYRSKVKATYYNGIELKGEPIYTTEYDELNFILHNSPPHDGLPTYNFSARYEFDICLDECVDLIMRCDDGASVWIDGNNVLEDKSCHSYKDWVIAKNVLPNKKHHIKVEYFQAGMDAVCMFCYRSALTPEHKTVYLPRGEWIDMFNGNVICGEREYSRKYGVHEMPLFVKRGALVPLWRDAQNTKHIETTDILLDYYPSKNENYDGELYLDDGETVAYKNGVYLKIPYSARYDRTKNRYVITVGKGDGAYKPLKDFKFTLRCNLIADDQVSSITVNGKDMPFAANAINKTSMPFSFDKSSNVSDTVTAEFTSDGNAFTKIEIKLY